MSQITKYSQMVGFDHEEARENIARDHAGFIHYNFVGSATVAPAKEVRVKEYTRKDGTVVKAHTKTVKDKDEKKAVEKKKS